ncbi:Uncharacterized protein ToN1_20940 [Aromatoleum petrolei]|nr:Uncharacterized protein ToN1_20940 [Aromatoleum petrolei]
MSLKQTNAQRFACSLDPVPTVMGIFARCMALDAFQRATPGAQPDAGRATVIMRTAGSIHPRARAPA